MRIKYNNKFFVDTLKDTGTVKSTTARVRQRAGKGFKSDVTVGSRRARGRVWADSFEARYEDAHNNILVRALHNG